MMYILVYKIICIETLFGAKSTKDNKVLHMQNFHLWTAIETL